MDYFDDIEIFSVSRMVTSRNGNLAASTYGALGLMLSGPAFLCLESGRELVEAPFLYWSPPCWLSAWGTPHGAVRDNLWLSARGERFDRIVASLDRIAPKRHIGLQKNGKIIDILERMREAHTRNTIADQRLLPLLLEELLYEIREALTSESVSGRIRSILKQLADRITESPGQDFDLPAFAKQHQLSVDYLRHCFLRYTKTPIHDFVLSQRYAQAIRMLRETNMPIGQISEACGFNHPGDFTRFFKKRSQLSPRKFRDNE